MNTQSLKMTATTNSNQRTIVSGRLKRPSKQLPSVLNPNKKPFLKQYSTAMQQKLQSLKEKINEKKKQKSNEQKNNQKQKGLNAKLQKFLKTRPAKQQKTFQNKLSKQQFSQFLTKSNLSAYIDILIQNQIDTLQILGEATQKQLQQIGIPKGHCLKIKVNIDKWIKINAKNQGNFDKIKQIQIRDTKTKDSERNTSFVELKQFTPTNNTKIQEKQIQNVAKKVQGICIGTDQDGLQQINIAFNRKQVQKNIFCLFCYQSVKKSQQKIQPQFCSQECEDRYNQMFKRYENNLIKAKEQFKTNTMNKNQGQQQKQDSLSQKHDQNQSQSENFDLLEDCNEFEDFDYQEYQNIKQKLW